MIPDLSRCRCDQTGLYPTDACFPSWALWSFRQWAVMSSFRTQPRLQKSVLGSTRLVHTLPSAPAFPVPDAGMKARCGNAKGRSGSWGRPSPPYKSERARRAVSTLFDQADDGVLSGRLLRHWTRRQWQSHGLRRRNCSVSRFFCIARQRSFDSIAGVRFPRPETRRPLVLMCTPLAGSIPSKPSTASGLARHS